MLIGEFDSNLGDKNRVAIPKRLRDNMFGKIYLTRGYEGCLILIDEERWNIMSKEIDSSSVFISNTRDLKRYLFGGAYEIEPDSQGRFVLSQQLIQFASIKEKIIFVGIGNWVEMWDQEKWNQKINQINLNSSQIAEKLNKNDRNKET